MADGVKTAPAGIIGILRTQHNESQEQLGAALGYNRDKVNNWERGQQKVNIPDLIKIAKHYGVTTDYLLGLSTVDKYDADQRGAEEYTGLGADALQHIKSFMSESETGACEKLSALLSSDLFYKLVNEIHNLDLDCTAAGVWIDAFTKVFLLNIPYEELDLRKELGFYFSVLCSSPDDLAANFYRSYSDVRLQLAELSEIWSDLLESLVPTADVIQAGKDFKRRYIDGEEGEDR